MNKHVRSLRNPRLNWIKEKYFFSENGFDELVRRYGKWVAYRIRSNRIKMIEMGMWTWRSVI